jgi:histidine phosphotransferase ChpT
MPHSPHDLAALLGSRICHDLINPLGAIGNGVELLRMTQASSPELELISDSVAHAQARIRMFRLAFGAVREEQRISGREIGSILEGLGKGGKLRFSWSLAGRSVAPGGEAAAACWYNAARTAMTVGRASFRSAMRGRNGSLWARPVGSGSIPRTVGRVARRASPPPAPSPAEVHFALIPQMLEETGRQLSMQADDETLKLSF